MQLCREYNKTAITKVDCRSNNDVLRTTLAAHLGLATSLVPHDFIDTIDALEGLSLLELQDYCTAHPGQCNHPELWEQLFARVFPDVYDAFSDVVLPDLEKSVERQFMPWRELYTQLLKLSAQPYTRRALEAILNDEREPLDAWRREELAEYDYLSLALAQVSTFYINELAKDNSPLLDQIALDQEQLLSIIRKNPVPRLLKKYYALGGPMVLDPTALIEAAEEAIRFDDMDVFLQLVTDANKWMKEHRIKPWRLNYGSLAGTAVKFDREEMLHYLLSDSFLTEVIDKVFLSLVYSAIKNHRLRILKILIEYYDNRTKGRIKKPDISVLGIKSLTEAYNYAIKEGDYNYIHLLLPYMSEPRYQEVVMELLGKIGKTADMEESVIDFMKYLLTHSKLSPLLILFSAMKGTNQGIINLVLDDPRSDAYFSDPELYFSAAIYNNGLHLTTILADRRSDPASVANEVISMVLQRNAEDALPTLYSLLEDNRIRRALTHNTRKQLKSLGIMVDDASKEKK